MAPKEGQQFVAGKNMKAPSPKVKRGSMLSAVEDIQRMSPDAIVEEFDRMVEHTERNLKDNSHMPCTKVATQLIRCLRQHQQASYMCFNVMEEYRNCVGLATQKYVDRLAQEEAEQEQEQEQRLNTKLLPVVPPQVTPLPGIEPQTEDIREVRHHGRSWLKPWTWLR